MSTASIRKTGSLGHSFIIRASSYTYLYFGHAIESLRYPFQKCLRLNRDDSAGPELLEHRRLLWDVVCVRCRNSDVLLAGVGVTSPLGGGGGGSDEEVVICVDARPLDMENPKPIDVETRLQYEECEADGSMAIFSKVR